MIIFTLLISGAVLIGALTLYTICSYVELKGYERGLDEAEQIVLKAEMCKSAKGICEHKCDDCAWNIQRGTK